ncbi:hypothetical protein Q4595_04280 [Wenyingzhuangia sp. 1_MG-2023]|nr:hypothetical protein [Wenyingzhuangia sp. 1_MG-2023]
MKAILKNSMLATTMLLGITVFGQGGDRSLDNFNDVGKKGVNVFEAPKTVDYTFDGLKVRIGGASTLQFQGVNHENSGAVSIVDIGDNFNLATANLDLDVALAKGMRMHLRTYLSSRHHNEPYVKGGYLQIDRLDFIQEGLFEDVMKYVTIKVGHMENNYGDAHFRRTDNAFATHNPFVGNLIMDAFTTEVGAEVYYRNNGWLAMLGATNAKLNQSVENPGKTGASVMAKLGFDKQLNDDLRVRLTGSVYHNNKVANSYLYTGDRSGARYYSVLDEDETATGGVNVSDFRTGRYNPNLKNEITALMFNPFLKYKGLEFFGTLESSAGKISTEIDDRVANQYAGELLYRFGANERYYLGSRYNKVSAEDATYGDVDIDRIQVIAGVFLTNNILAKLEYVSQKYDGFGSTSEYEEGKFNGIMLEAAISF